ncbi:hypothetical protein OAM71_00590 [Pelagibacteraceae bacterium]|nr:hypothetical protein [Pelagibacteraceae bacterium]
MWTIIKFEKKKLIFLKENFEKILGKSFVFYKPKILTQQYLKNKIKEKEYDLLGDYVFCYHEKFKQKEVINILKYSKGLKYFLNGFEQCQEDINRFITECKASEDDKGYLSKNFYKIIINNNYKFLSGAFTGSIFKIIGLQNKKIEILLGNIKTTVNKEEFCFRPL